MNQVVIIGNLTRDPELRYSTGGNQTAICRFTVAVNERRRNPQTQEWEEDPSFIPVVVFGKQAENCDRYLAKGRKVAINGRIKTGSYTNKEGNKIYTTDVIANSVEFLSSRNEADQSFGQGFGGMSQSAPAQHSPAESFEQAPAADAPASDAGGIPEGFQAIEDDDIPF